MDLISDPGGLAEYEFKRLEITTPEPGIALVTLNRPEKLNALDPLLFAEIALAAERVCADDEIRVGVYTGAGRGFCAGADLASIAELPDSSVTTFYEHQRRGAESIARIKRAHKPLIAAVNGPATGGGLALALACDVRIAAPEARFNVAFIRLGISGADVGTSWLLPRVVGMGHASELMLTGRLIDADEAERIGLVNAVVPAGDLIDVAIEKAREIARNSPFALRLTKEALQMAIDAPSIEAAIEIENRNQVLASRSEDMGEALAAFMEKREPQFKNR